MVAFKLRTSLACASFAALAAAGLLAAPATAGARGAAAPVPVPATPRQSMDAVAPRLIADALTVHVVRGNRMSGVLALREYRMALALLERFLRAGGNDNFTAGTAAALGRAFFDRGDRADARRCWRLTASADPQAAPDTPRGEAVADVTRGSFRAGLVTIVRNYEAERVRVRAFSTVSISTGDFSPDLQFDRALDALTRGDVAAGRRLTTDALGVDPNFAEAYILRGFIDAASGNRRDAQLQWLYASTAFEGINTPDVRSYASFEAGTAARLLIAVTASRGS